MNVRPVARVDDRTGSKGISSVGINIFIEYLYFWKILESDTVIYTNSFSQLISNIRQSALRAMFLARTAVAICARHLSIQ